MNYYDPTYAERLTMRNRNKAAIITRNVPLPAKTALDIGCNAGYLSQALLDSGVKQVTGIEGSDVTTIDHPSFTVWRGDVMDYRWSESFDVTLYCAVHHHVLHQYGRTRAEELWHNIVTHTNTAIIFETGLIGEIIYYPEHGMSGDLDWVGGIRQSYGDNEEYLSALWMVEGIESWQQLAKLGINGTWRPVYLIRKGEVHGQKK